MHPLVRGAAAAALLTALNGVAGPPPAPIPSFAPQIAGVDSMPLFCGPRAVPEGPVCVPLPPPGVELDSAEPLVPEPGASLRQPSHVREQIPRHPDRPADPALYRYPVGGTGAPPVILSGYDLDLPAARQDTAGSISTPSAAKTSCWSPWSTKKGWPRSPSRGSCSG
jgi:hypothetical protein